MRDQLSFYRTDLESLARMGRRRALATRSGYDFSSNDYLGLAASPELAAAMHAALSRGVPVGATGSRLLRGNHPEHEALEAEAASFFGASRCLYFGGGYTANLAVFSTLPQRDDLVLFDFLSHASTRAGVRAGRAASTPFRHNDAGHVDAQIRRWRQVGGIGAPWIAAESVYSMDGDRAPIGDLLGIAETHGGFLVVDEAHATGVLGQGGRGLAAAFEGRPSLVTLHTCGKALGASGGILAGDHTLLDFLVNRAQPFIYATAPSPLMAAAVRAGLSLVADGDDRRRALGDLVAYAGRLLRERLGMAPSGTQIIPFIVGEDARASRLAAHIQAAGFDCRAIRPPTVPEGTARLRISLTLNVDRKAVATLVEALVDATSCGTA